MTVTDLILLVRETLRDTGRGEAVVKRKYDDDVIIRALSDANLRLAQSLIDRKAWVTVNKLVKTTLVSDPFPSDFWKLIAGIRTTTNADTFIPAYHPQIARALRGRGHDVLSVIDGAFFGNAETAIYWRKPQAITITTSGDLTDFPEPYYYSLRFLAAQILIASEKRDAKRRHEHMQRMLIAKARLLK